MNEKERLLHTLFDSGHPVTKNIKFMRGDKPDISEEDFCREINSALLQVKSGLAKPAELIACETRVNISGLIAAL